MRFLVFTSLRFLVPTLGFKLIHIPSARQTWQLYSAQDKDREGQQVITEQTNFTDPSTLRVDEISNFGVCTALAEEHIKLGNYEDAKKLAFEAMKIGQHT